MKNAEMPAYPTCEEDRVCLAGGLTKRELIAAMAMQGMLSNSDLSVGSESVIKINASLSCEYADALLAELEKK